MRILHGLIAAAVVLGVEPSSAGPPAPSASRSVDAFVQAFIKRQAIPSAAVAVVRDGRIVKAAGYGTASLEQGVPASERSVYEIGSISKQFTAEATMMLADEGRLHLDDPIGKYLSGLPEAWSAITIRHILSHTSGLHDWEAKGVFSYRRNYTPQEYVDLIAADPLDFAPGTRYAYTNSAHPLLGLIIEKVSGRPYEPFVTERIFKPAGMTDTRFKHPEEIVPRRAAGYVDRDGTLQNGEPLRPGIIAPNGGIMSTAVDMAKWQIALGNGTLLPRPTLDEMWTPIRLNDGKPFNNVGLAWFIQTFRGHRLVLHNGSTIAGYSSVVYRYPDDRLAVVALMNIDRWNAVNVLATRVADFYVPGLAAAGLPDRPDPDAALSRRFLEMLAAIAQGRDSDLLADRLRTPGKASRLPATFGYGGDVQRFAFLEREDLGPSGQERFGNIVRWLYRYRLVSRSATICYTFEVTPDGKVTSLVPERE
jgi:CubicO group peptidase (beta-lactamase class C family)